LQYGFSKELKLDIITTIGHQYGKYLDDDDHTPPQNPTDKELALKIFGCMKKLCKNGYI
jgi:hypothetical protein